MRTEQSSKNAITSLVFYFINYIFNFIFKTIFIHFLGIEYAGLNSLFTNILGVLNTAELGIGTAVGYSLYKPLAENDTRTINEILKLYKYLYRIIAIFILVVGLILTFFLQYFITSNISLTEIRFSFVLYLIATVVSYLFTFLNILPSADQRKYIVDKIQGISRIIKNIIQLIAIVVYRNYYVWLILEITWNIAGYVYTNIYIKNKYKYYKNVSEINFKQLFKKYKEIILRVRDIFFHKIGELTVNQTDNIVISCFCTLADVGIYGNYISVINLVIGIFEKVFGSITASVGNLIIKKGEKEAYNLWKEIHIITLFFTTICCYLFYKLINKFIIVWVGEEYILSQVIVLFLTLNIMFRLVKQPIDNFKQAFGMFWDKKAPLIESCINLIVSVTLASQIGILGVIIGTFVSNIIIIAMWKPYIVFKYGFKEKIIEYIKINFPVLILSILSICISNIIIDFITFENTHKWLELISMGIIYTIIITTVTLMLFMCNKDFKKSIVKYTMLLKKIIFKKK